MSSCRPAGLPDVEVNAPIVLVVSGRVTAASVAALCAELEALLHPAEGPVPGPGAAVDCDVGGVRQPGLALVEAIARLGLVARRAGAHPLRLRRVTPEVRALLDLVGLAGVVTLDPPEPSRAPDAPRRPSAGRGGAHAGPSGPP